MLTIEQVRQLSDYPRDLPKEARQAYEDAWCAWPGRYAPKYLVEEWRSGHPSIGPLPFLNFCWPPPKSWTPRQRTIAVAPHVNAAPHALAMAGSAAAGAADQPVAFETIAWDRDDGLDLWFVMPDGSRQSVWWLPEDLHKSLVRFDSKGRDRLPDPVARGEIVGVAYAQIVEREIRMKFALANGDLATIWWPLNDIWRSDRSFRDRTARRLFSASS